MLLCFLFPGTLKYYIETFIGGFSSCPIVVSVLWDLGYIFWVLFGVRHHLCGWVVLVGLGLFLVVPFLVELCWKESIVVIMPWHWVFLYLWCLLLHEFFSFPSTWIIPLFLLLFLQMTPLLSKKMDQFLGESWGCLFIITINTWCKDWALLSRAPWVLYQKQQPVLSPSHGIIPSWDNLWHLWMWKLNWMSALVWFRTNF